MPSKFQTNNSGFTLVELVIVVAIIGILATAILSGTNFIDQRAQSVDVGNYNIARNLQSSFEQYVITTGLSDLDFGTAEPGKLLAPTSDANVTKLINNGILKNNYQIPVNTFYLSKDASNNIIVQFAVTSTRYRTSICPSNTSSTTPCYFKVPSSGALK